MGKLQGVNKLGNDRQGEIEQLKGKSYKSC